MAEEYKVAEKKGDFCPFLLSQQEGKESIFRCKVKPDPCGEGQMICLVQHDCPIWKEIMAAEKRGFESGVAYKTITSMTH